MQKLIQSKKRDNGFTLVELMVVVAVIGLLVAIAVPVYTSNTETAKIATDDANLRILNAATVHYRFGESIDSEDLFEGIEDNQARMNRLIDAGYLLAEPQPQSPENVFSWDSASITEGGQIWRLTGNSIEVPLTPLGSSFEEISKAMIYLLSEFKNKNNRYARDWKQKEEPFSDFRFLDIGLDPSFWHEPINHIYYKPAGKLLRIKPEEGYNFILEKPDGSVQVLTSRINYDLVYNIEKNKWYYHSDGLESNEVVIDTLQVVKAK
jgi:prepilin-type N-terminal cleavage/methylation domain-containing protein